jgi:hypothetical protein
MEGELMQVTEATIHRIQKAAHTSGEGSATTQIREGNLPIDDTLLTVSRDLPRCITARLTAKERLGPTATFISFPSASPLI